MKKSTLIITLILLVLIAAGVARWAGVVPGFSGTATPAAAAAAPAPVPVSVASALERSVTEWDEFSGRVRAIDRVDIRPQVSGIIESVYFQDGQLVKKGDALFTIDPRPFQAELARSQAVLAGAQARVAFAQTNQDRNTRLIASHAIAQSDLDQTNDAMLEAKASVLSAEAAVQTAQLNLNYTAITAPVTGRVSRAEITIGNWVGAGLTAPVLTTVVSVSPVYVEFEIDEQTFLKYADNGAAGNTGIEHVPVSMELANESDFPHQGRLESLDNQLDTSSGTIRVRAVFDNGHGELVDDRAVGTDQDKKYVMVVDAGNKATYRGVTLGPVVNGLRIIRSGLTKGERIVVDGLQRVQPNSIVAPTDVTMDREAATTPQVAASSTK
jgi:multidrug efflux system membrane fusion protein